MILKYFKYLGARDVFCLLSDTQIITLRPPIFEQFFIQKISKMGAWKHFFIVKLPMAPSNIFSLQEN